MDPHRWESVAGEKTIEAHSHLRGAEAAAAVPKRLSASPSVQDAEPKVTPPTLNLPLTAKGPESGDGEKSLSSSKQGGCCCCCGLLGNSQHGRRQRGGGSSPPNFLPFFFLQQGNNGPWWERGGAGVASLPGKRETFPLGLLQGLPS